MKDQQKVMVFIARPKGNDYEWFSRHNAPHPKHGPARWYIVTGNLDNGETHEQAAIREVQEETGINTHTRLIKLDLVSEYDSEFHLDSHFVEHGFLLVTDFRGEIKLNEESNKYKWLLLDEFVAKIWWTDNREKLSKLLQAAIT